MTDLILLIKFFLLAAAAIVLIPCTLWTVRYLCRLFPKKGSCRHTRRVRSGISRVLAISFVLLCGVFCLRFAVGLYSTAHPFPDTDPLTVGEEVANSFLHALQSFTLDEDYTAYVVRGRQMLADPALIAPAAVPGWQLYYSILVTLLNIAAPIAGGSILFEILSGIFPRIRLFCACLNPWKKKYFFSELNEGSLALAESIADKAPYRLFRPAILFTDAYRDEENEKRTELFRRAKSFGAVCIRDDLAHFVTKRVRGAEYFLIDNREIENLKTFAALAQEPCRKRLRGSVIRIFYQNDAYMLTERRIRKGIFDRFLAEVKAAVPADSARYKKRLAKLEKPEKERKPDADPITEKDVYDSLTEDVAPVVLRTRAYQTLVYQLLETKMPIYTPLTDDPETDSLEIAILGAGGIGMEMFLTSSWCGQLLGTRLGLNIVTLEKEEEIDRTVGIVNGEILAGTRKNDPILSVYSDSSKYNDPYFTYRRCSADVNRTPPEEITFRCPADPKDSLPFLDADYFFISLGSDDANIQAAERLKRSVILRQRETGEKNTVIVCVVYNAALCASMNVADPENPFVKMMAVGGLDDVYSYENIILYADQKQLQDEAFSENNRYGYWSNVARRIHEGCRRFSVFAELRRRRGTALAWEDWHAEDYVKACQESTALYCRLGWLEHRRWNAYLRSIGFCSVPPETEKNISLRIHPCLVECDAAGTKPERPDRLDLVSKAAGARRDKKLLEQGKDPKKYDPVDYKNDDLPDLTCGDTANGHR